MSKMHSKILRVEILFQLLNFDELITRTASIVEPCTGAAMVTHTVIRNFIVHVPEHTNNVFNVMFLREINKQFIQHKDAWAKVKMLSSNFIISFPAFQLYFFITCIIFCCCMSPVQMGQLKYNAKMQLHYNIQYLEAYYLAYYLFCS